MEYNYFSSYGDYGSPTTLIPKKTVDDITANAPEELDTFKEVADKIKEIDGGGSGSDIDVDAINKKIDDNKSEADAKFEEINSVLDSKADTDALANLATKDEVEQVKSDVQAIIQDAPEELDTLKEIADLLTTKEDASDVIEALSTKVSTSDFNAHVSSNDASFAEINEALSNKADSSELENYATSDYVDEKVAGITVPSNLSELTNDVNYVQDANYVHTDNNYSTEDKDKLAGLSNYDETALVGRVEALENANYVEDANYVHTDNNYTTEEKNKLESLNNYDDTELAGRVTALEEANYVEDANYVHTDNNYTTEEKDKLEGLSNYDDSELDARVVALEDAGFLTKTTGDERYYDKATTDSIFVAKSQYEDDMELKADKNELGDYATDSELASALHDLVVRLNKLEAQNTILVEKGTDSADDITGMTDGDALNADIVVATDSAIEALSTPKTFNSITLAGGEVGDNTVINLLAKDSIDVNSLTVSGTKGNGNGKIVYGSNDITISNVNIEPGCTVYNVFEGKQDKAEDNLVENFTATNVIVDDIDLRHNVFNIYQLADGANILVKDSRFNLNVANSNVMRVSNITNAKNVTITFQNIDWTYENKPYTDADKAWAGLLIYQPYGSDDAYNADFTSTQTWTINVKNCRYNGEPVTENFIGTIKQSVYQYDVNKSGATEAPGAFGSVIFE